MATITTFSATERNGNVSYLVDVRLKFEEFEYTEFRSKELSKAQQRYDEAVQAVKEGWHP